MVVSRWLLVVAVVIGRKVVATATVCVWYIGRVLCYKYIILIFVYIILMFRIKE